jgi:DNA-directed RNA polymerase III subunit RPC6
VLDALLLLQQIKLSGNSGIWVRDIKLQTNIQQVTINKALKGLESRSLIKSVKAVHSKSKKLYMLFELSKYDLDIYSIL